MQTLGHISSSNFDLCLVFLMVLVISPAFILFLGTWEAHVFCSRTNNKITQLYLHLVVASSKKHILCLARKWGVLIMTLTISICFTNNSMQFICSGSFQQNDCFSSEQQYCLFEDWQIRPLALSSLPLAHNDDKTYPKFGKIKMWKKYDIESMNYES